MMKSPSVKIFMHIHMYVCMYVSVCKTNAIFSYKENIFERKTYSVKSSFFLFHIRSVPMTEFSKNESLFVFVYQITRNAVCMWAVYFVTVILIDISEFNPLENCGRNSRCKYDKRPTV